MDWDKLQKKELVAEYQPGNQFQESISKIIEEASTTIEEDEETDKLGELSISMIRANQNAFSNF